MLLHKWPDSFPTSSLKSISSVLKGDYHVNNKIEKHMQKWVSRQQQHRRDVTLGHPVAAVTTPCGGRQSDQNGWCHTKRDKASRYAWQEQETCRYENLHRTNATEESEGVSFLQYFPVDRWLGLLKANRIIMLEEWSGNHTYYHSIRDLHSSARRQICHSISPMATLTSVGMR